MISKIKNTSSKKNSFNTFEIAKGKTHEIVWDKDIITPLVLSEIIKAYNEENISILDENDEVISSTIEVEFYTLKANGEQSAKPKKEQVDGVIAELNKRYNKMRSEE